MTDLMNGDRQVQSYIADPAEACETASTHICNLLRQHGIDYEVRAMQLWESAGDPEPANHYVVIAKLGGHRIALDVTAGQFASSSQIAGPIIANERIWLEKLRSLGDLANQAIHYRDFSSSQLASNTLASGAEHPYLTTPGWRILHPLPQWARDIVHYPRWGTAYQRFQQSLNGPTRLRPTAEQRVQQELSLAALYRGEVEPFHRVELKIDKGEIRLPRLLVDRSTLNQAMASLGRKDVENTLLTLDRYHREADSLTVAEKIARLSDLAKQVESDKDENFHEANFSVARFLETFSSEVRAYAIGLLRQNDAREMLNLRPILTRPSVLPISNRRRNGVGQISYADAIARLDNLLDDEALQALRTASGANSSTISQRVADILSQNQIGYEVRGLLLWENEGDIAPRKHYVVIAYLGGNKVALDLYAGQYAGEGQSNDPIIANVKNWEERFLALDQVRGRAINYHTFRSMAVAQASLNRDLAQHQLTDTVWTILGKPPSWAEKIVKYPVWGARYLQLSQAQTRGGNERPTRQAWTDLGILWNTEAASLEAVELQIRSGERSIPAQLWTRAQLIIKAGQTIAARHSAVLDLLDVYHSHQAEMSLRWKIDTLCSIANALERFANSSLRGARNYTPFADEVRAYAIGLRLRDGALAHSISDSEGGWQWREPVSDALNRMALDMAEPAQALGYQRQLIIQLEGDDNSFAAARNLFGKHPRHSEWMQWRGEANPLAQGWSASSGRVQSMAPLQLDSEGRVRIVLIGHGSKRDGQTLFGFRSALELQTELETLVARLPANKITGIHLDLVGCELVDRQLPAAQTLPGQLAAWLQSQADMMGLGRGAVSLSARAYPVRVNAEGKKEILTEEYGWVSKESARLRDLLHKLEWRWDSEAQQMAPMPEPLESLLEVGRDIESVVHHTALSDEERAALVELHQQVGDEVRRHLLGEQAPDAEHRGSVSAYAVQNIGAIHRAEQWSIAVQTLKQRESLDASWLATVQVRRSRAGGGMEIRFIKRDTGEVRWVRDENPIFAQFYDISSMTAHLADAFQWSAADNRLVVRPGLEQSRGVSSLNAAFMLQTLMSVNPRNGGLNAVSDAAKVQIYSQLVQNSVGLADDAAQLTGLIRSALGAEWNLAARGTELMSRVAGVANPVLDAVNIAATVVELQQTSDPTARAVIEARLGTSVVMSGLNIASLIAGLTGAGAAAAGLSALAVPLTGLAVGLPALVENYQRLRQGFDQASQRLDAIANSIESAGFHLEHGIWQLNPGAVVDRIDFRSGQLHYGSVEINATKGGSAHTVTGGWDHYFARPDPDTHRWLDVYAGLGLAREQAFSLDASQPNLPVLLPAAISRRLTFDYQQVTGRRTASAPAMDRLRAHFGTDFVPRMYAFPTDWAIYRLDETRRSTAIEVNLDASTRSLIMPTVADADDRGLLSYTLNGGGGAYAVVLPANPLNLRVEASGNAQERWIFDVDYALKQHSIQDGRVVLGELKPQVFSGLRIENNSISIGGHTVSFQGVNRPAAVLLRHRIGDGAQICLNVDLAGRRYESSLLLNETPEGASLTQLQQFFSSSDAQILLRNGRIAMVVGSEAGEIEVASGLSAILPFRLSAPETEGSGLPNANMNSQRLAHAMTGLSSPDAGADVLRTVDASRSTPMLTHTI
ncbi:hypothetical protein BUE93_06665 [Chromobacterium amazonense]|uniref:Peptidase C80 domain-containing protein n=2 Tax=Chromobacterium amazonense TaxID=1382803 RepID=A0A2S9X705_9NEIS|nr:hypothetical protein BUE93_06665 [Chromobacterium amazonense]